MSTTSSPWHAMVGGLAAKFGGGDFASGAFGAGATTAISGTVNNIFGHGIAGAGKCIYDELSDDVNGLKEMFLHPLDAAMEMKDTAEAIYQLGQEQGFVAVIKELGNAVGGDWINQYNTIQNDNTVS